MPGSAQGHSTILLGVGPTSFNWHGSIPTVQADTKFEPNFRHFDFFLNPQGMPNEELAARVYKVPDGESHWHLRTFWGQNIRCTPVVLTSVAGAGFVNFFYTRFLNRSGASIRWAFLKCYAVIFVWNNFTKFIARERYFQRDFQRNQIYSYDEMRDQRDRQRVREALYEKQFVKNPVAEYRVKAWQVAERFA